MLTPTKFSLADAATIVPQNIVASVYGGSKTGKSHFALRSARPLYLVYLDTNPNIGVHLINSSKEMDSMTGEPFGDMVEVLNIPPMNGKKYPDFSQREADEIITSIEFMALRAKEEAAARVAQGLPAGTFVVDGGTMLKGYFEKAELGESNTLGGRPTRGQKWPSQIEYAKSNARMFEFISGFVNQQLDFIITFEGREEWVEYLDDSGRKNRKPSGKMRPARSSRLPYAMTCEVETLKVLEPIVVNNRPSGHTVVPKIRVDWNAFGLQFETLLLPARTFSELRAMFLSTLPASTVKSTLLTEAVPADGAVVANTSSFDADS